MVDAAKEQWLAAASDAQDPFVKARLNGFDFVITDLDAGALAQTSGSTIAIDVDAAGQGWFVDTSPGSNNADEFSSTGPAG